MAIDDKVEVLGIEKGHLSSVTDEESLNDLRADYQVIERLLK